MTEPKPPSSDRPSATAVAASFQDLEDKLLRMLSQNHEAQMAEIRRGANEMLRRYQEAWTVHLRAFDNEFGRAIGELQDVTHRTANRVQKIESERDDEKRERAREMATIDRRLRTIEKWYQDALEKRDTDPGDDPCPSASSSTTNQ